MAGFLKVDDDHLSCGSHLKPAQGCPHILDCFILDFLWRETGRI
jgi:hypothetical protein